MSTGLDSSSDGQLPEEPAEGSVLHRQASAEAAEILAQERRRIGQILHDGLCQNLVGALFALKAVAHRPAASGIADELDTVVRLLDEAASKARKLAGELNPPTVDACELEAAFCDLAASLKIADRISVSVQGRFVLSGECAETVLEIATAAFQSIARQPSPSRISLRLFRNGPMVEFRIEAEPGGASFESVENVPALRARVERLGGALRTEASATAGPALICTLPSRGIPKGIE